ncbi:MAG: hypothetical protein PVI82_05920 [Desulfobacterales bacterium]
MDFTDISGKRQGREVPQSLRVEPGAKRPVWKTQSIAVLIYNTEYELGNGQEKITLMKGFWDRDFQIIGHYFESAILG